MCTWPVSSFIIHKFKVDSKCSLIVLIALSKKTFFKCSLNKCQKNKVSSIATNLWLVISVSSID